MAHYLLDDLLEDVEGVLLALEDHEFADEKSVRVLMALAEARLKTIQAKLLHGQTTRNKKRRQRAAADRARLAGERDLRGNDA